VRDAGTALAAHGGARNLIQKLRVETRIPSRKVNRTGFAGGSNS
jgi:hypothetical protein